MNGPSRVATETLLRLVATNRASERVFERRRHCRLMSDREVELAKFFKVTDARFVKNVVVTKQVRLADVALAETVKNRFANAFRAVADGVDDGIVLARELVCVRSVLERQLSARGDDATIRRDFERLAHWGIQLRRLRLVTVETRFAADIAHALRVRVRPPVGEDVLSLSVAKDAHQQRDRANPCESI